MSLQFKACPFILIALLGGCDNSKPAEPKSSPSNASQTTPSTPTPPATLSSEAPRWSLEPAGADFGTVWAGETVRMPFKYRNIGKQALKILEVKSKCACSAAEDYTREVAPGEVGTLTFELDTLHKRGPVRETLSAQTNDPGQPEMVMTLAGTVKAVAETEVISDLAASQDADPEKALEKIKKASGSFGTIKPDQRLQRVVKIKNTTGKPLTLKVLPIEPANSPFSAQVEEKVPGEEYLVTITGDPPFKFGASLATLPFETNVPGQPIYRLGMSAYVPTRVEVRPTRIVVDPRYPFIKQRRLVFKNYGNTPVRITGIAKTDEKLDVRLDPSTQADPNQHIILVDLPGNNYNEYSPPPYADIIRIDTDDAQFKSFEIYVVPSIDTPTPPPPRPADKPVKWTAVPARN